MERLAGELSLPAGRALTGVFDFTEPQAAGQAAERVMGEFDRHLIQPALGKHPGDGPGFRLGWRHRLAYLRFKLSMKLA